MSVYYNTIMNRQLTPEQTKDYTNQLRRVGKLIHNRIADEMKRAKFIDAYPSLDDAEHFSALENIFHNLGNQLDSTRTYRGLEDIIRDLTR
jgi:hypothetical protein